MNTILQVSLLALGLLLSQAGNIFGPDGYYMAQPVIQIGRYEIQNFNVHTVDYYVNGKLDYEHPKIVEPTVILSLTKKGALKEIRLTSSGVIITRDTLFFVCNSSDLGEIQFAGNFLDKRGMYWNRENDITDSTIVAMGQFTVTKNKRVVYSRHHKLTFFGGD